MASKYEPSLRALAMEPNEDRRLEMAAEIDRDAADLDERWDSRDEYSRMEAERDRVAAERDEAIVDRDEAIVDRDEWKKRYADRFFDLGEGITDRRIIVDSEIRDVKMDGEKMGYRRLWEERAN